MMDSRLPWFAAIAGSRTDLDAGGSSTALHSIYGSQVFILILQFIVILVTVVCRYLSYQ